MGQGLFIHVVSRSHKRTHHTFRRRSLDGGSACRRDLYLSTTKTSAGDRPQTYALDRAASSDWYRTML